MFHIESSGSCPFGIGPDHIAIDSPGVERVRQIHGHHADNHRQKTVHTRPSFGVLQRRLTRLRSRAGWTSTPSPLSGQERRPCIQALRDERVHPRKVIANTGSAVYHERRVPMDTVDQRFEEAFDGGDIDETERHLTTEPLGKRLSPRHEPMKVLG